MALKLEDFDAHQRALEFWRSVTALLERPAFRRERKLREQISDANDSISANLAEGFEQPTDRAFGNFVFHAKGSTAEVLARLREAHIKKCLTQEELDFHLRLGDEVRRLLAGLARYLYKSDFKDRGRYKALHEPGPAEQERLPAENPERTSLNNVRDLPDEGPGTQDHGPRS
jgi:four helix bundle protein